ncbi:protein kinase domain-containing protein [Allocoleopsis franciscana]|uniref:protein kinase domain-containing protein n=1 Tax=Allocoleopsis franciscana TaxID=2886352 RepID=UPI00155A7166|nr:protein kinase [Allocoleopsis franciscana]
MTSQKTVENNSMVDMIGQLLARRYQILRVLGAGAFGQTYVAQDTHIPGNPTCVVKHLKPATNSPKLLETARELFQREAETLVKLGKHEQIPQLLAYFEEDQEFYLVQEFIEGHTLSHELQPGQRWSETQVIPLLSEVLEILEFVHSYGVIHRDIKPDNIMRRACDQKLVLIDFGAIKQVQIQPLNQPGQEPSVATSIRIGTPGYTPTEQDWGKPRHNSDLYALGIVAIQALTGLYPHQFPEDDETGELFWQHQTEVSSGVATILTKMVRYHFKDRYQSATEALQALQQLSHPSLTVHDNVMDQVSHDVPEPLLSRIAPTVQPSAVPTTRLNTTSSFSGNPTRLQVRGQTHSSCTSRHRLSLLMKIGVVMLVSVGGGYAYRQGYLSNLGLTSTSTANSIPIGTPTPQSDSTVHSKPTALSTANSNATPNLVRTDTLITNSNTTDNLVRTDTLIPSSDATPNLVRTVSLITNSDTTPNLVKKGTLITNSDTTPNLVKISQSSNQPDASESFSDNGSSQLKNAKKAAREGNFKRAIALAEQISSKSSVYQQSLNEIAQWQGEQRQQRIKQQAEIRARTLLAKARDVANQGEETDMKTAIRIAEEAIAQVSPDHKISREAQNAIAQWQQQATAKPEQEAVASSYKCSCQPNDLDTQQAVTLTESQSDLTGSSCSINEVPETPVLRAWVCSKQ